MSSKRPLSPEEFRDIYSRATRLCVDLIIKASEGIVLCLRNIEPYKGEWHFPGGTVLYKEKITDAIDRVAKEEIGISVKAEKILGYIEYPREEEERGFGYTITMAFLCSAETNDFKHNDESSEVKVFKEMPVNLIEEQRQFLKSVWEEIK